MENFSRLRPADPPAGEWTPGAGWARAREVFGDRLPEITEADERRVDEMIAQAGRRSHPVHNPSAQTQ